MTLQFIAERIDRLENDGEKLHPEIIRAMKRVLRDGPESIDRHAAHLARGIAWSLTESSPPAPCPGEPGGWG